MSPVRMAPICRVDGTVTTIRQSGKCADRADATQRQARNAAGAGDPGSLAQTQKPVGGSRRWRHGPPTSLVLAPQCEVPGAERAGVSHWTLHPPKVIAPLPNSPDRSRSFTCSVLRNAISVPSTIVLTDQRDRLRAPTSAPKIAAPPLPSCHVSRARLEGLLSTTTRGEQHASIATVCAPPGFGKSTLLATWTTTRQRAGAITAWINLDDHDNHPTVLWSAVLNALEKHEGLASAFRRTALRVPQPGEENCFITNLVNVFDQQEHEIWVVLDDFHRLTEPAALRGLELLLERFPTGLHLMISSRTNPPLPMQRFKVAGELLELRSNDLCFTATEAAALLSSHDVALSQQDLTRLMARTEGWPVGLRLAALTLSGSADYSSTIDSFIETDHAVADYLMAEVLSVLPASYQDFLLATSVCDSFTIELASTLTGRDDAGTLLNELEQSYGLASRCSPHSEWFRYHSLLLEHLRAALQCRSLSDLRGANRTAARWFSERGHALTAIGHAIRAGDECLMASLVVEHGPALILNGRMLELGQLGRRFPSRVANRPGVSAMLAVADLATGDCRTAAERLTRLVRTEVHEQRDFDVILVALAHHARLTGRLSPQLDRLSERLDDITDPDLRILLLVNRGSVLFWLGQLRSARNDLTQALHLARERGYDYAALHCLSQLSGVAGAESNYPLMRKTAEEAIGFAHVCAIGDSPAACLAHVAAAWVAYQTLDDDVARREAETAGRMLSASNDRTVELAARSMMSIARFAQEPRDALLAMRECWNAVDTQEHVQPAVVACASTAEQKMAQRLGRADWAAEAEHRAAHWLSGTGDHALLRARAHALHGRTIAARTELRKITNGDIKCLVVSTEVEAHLLAARLAERVGDQQAASTELSTALDKAAPGEMLRPFSDEGPDIRPLIAAQIGRCGWADSFADTVLAAVPAAYSHSELSPREIQLLRELPSPATLEEIAGSLFISINTIKTHLRSIYRKLGVTTRRDAVLTARERGLL